MRKLVVLFLALALMGCFRSYELVAPAPAPITVAKKGMLVQPSVSWNRMPRGTDSIPREESWTQNGPLLDSITFVAGLKPGDAIVRQRRKATRKTPVFRATMTPQDLVSMLESAYRVKARVTVFETTGVKPIPFVGSEGVQFDYAYVTQDEVKRRGRAVMAIVGDKLYLICLDGAALHYFDAAVPEFERLVASAKVPPP